MENPTELFETICRVCLSYGNSENMVKLTDNTAKDGLSCYGQAVYIFTNITVKNDSFPNKMCNECLLLLKQAILFRKTCENSNKKLLKLVRKCDPTKSNFQQKLNEYVMFVNDFPEESRSETSQTHSVIKLDKKTKAKTENKVKNEVVEMDIENSLDFDDIFPLECKDKTSKLNTEDDIDFILENMELVTEVKQTGFKKYRKKYRKQKKQLNPNLKLIYQRQSRTKQRQAYEKRKRKLNSNQSELDLQCKVCMKVLANLDSLQAHMLRHSGGQFICEQCGRTFVTIAELKYHLACTHDIGAQYICKECGYKAPKKYELIEHERIHTGERPFACDKCGLTFRTRYIWKKHAIYHREKTVQCQQCPKKFYVKGELIAHVNGVHERMYIYACSQCDVTYAKTSTVRRHMVEKHGISREMQGKIKRIDLGKTSTVWNSAKGKERLSQNV